MPILWLFEQHPAGLKQVHLCLSIVNFQSAMSIAVNLYTMLCVACM